MLFDAAGKPPVSASISAARLRRSWPRARAALSSGAALPAISAFSMARPETPKTSLITLASLMLTVSSSRNRRLRSAACASMSLRR